MAITTFAAGNIIKSAEVNTNFNNSIDGLGEVKMFALSISGAVTKASLQGRGWAICDGTTPAVQGISTPTIATTPDLTESFIRGSANETTGGTGGSSTVTLDETQIPSHTHTVTSNTDNELGNNVIDSKGAGTGTFQYTSSSTGGGLAHENKPPYYNICYFMKVK